MTSRPLHQRIIVASAAAVSGLLAFGTFLDALSNAVTLITPRVTYVGSAALALTGLLAHISFRHRPISWVARGQLVRIRGLGLVPISVLSGMLTLLWLPRVVAYEKPHLQRASATGVAAAPTALATAAPTRVPSPTPPRATAPARAANRLVPTASPSKELRSTSIEVDGIQQVSVEVRVTCDRVDDTELPPAQVDWMPIGGGVALLRGPAGEVRLPFVNPVRFKTVDPDQIVVINRFSLEPGSEIRGRPFAILKNFDDLFLPVQTVVWGKSLRRIRLLEVSFYVNSRDPIYRSYRYDVLFQEGLSFTVPISLLLGNP